MDKETLKMVRRWLSMLQRCYDPDDQGWEYYGGRGITVCFEWHNFESYFSFFGYPPFSGASVERIDNSKGYYPCNCKWASSEEQNCNTRRSKYLTLNGKTQTTKEWAQEFNIGPRRLAERIRRGWSLEKALATPSPVSFQAEREDNIKRSKDLWQKKGSLYKARSRHRRGRALSAYGQLLVSEHGPLPQQRSKYSLAKIEEIALMHINGLSVRTIAAATCIPKSTVQYLIQQHMRKEVAPNG
jgi:hypothetical protein